MRAEPEMGAPSMIALSWLAAAVALPLALVTACLGQAVGAVAGGCEWIGVSLPVHRQVWALVNQPVLNFSSLSAAGPYWVGSWIGPMLVALTALAPRPRSRSAAGELLVIQIAWSFAAVAGSWLPLLDGSDGHLARWLLLHGLPSALIWTAPCVAAAVSSVAAARLLDDARRRRPDLGRLGRLLLTSSHLLLPMICWVGLACTLRKDVPGSALAATGLQVAALVSVACLRQPSPAVRGIRPPSWWSAAILPSLAVILGITLWTAGGPTGDGRVRGMLWGTPGSFNNIRPWIAVDPGMQSRPEPEAGQATADRHRRSEMVGGVARVILSDGRPRPGHSVSSH